MAFTCKLNQNVTRQNNCSYNLPEINEILLASFDDIATSAITLSSTTAGCESVASISTGVTWYKIEPAKGSASFTDELVVEDNGNRYRTHTLTFNTIGAYNACSHLALDDLSLGKYVAIVKTPSGNIMLGRVAGLEATTATLSAGGDTNGMQVILSANVTESALPIDAAVEPKVYEG